MIFYLRNKKNETILDVDCYVKCEERFGGEGDYRYVELGAVVCIEPYSKFLLESPEDQRAEIIADFDNLQELRGWLWEKYFMKTKNTRDEYDNVIKALRPMIKGIADKYELCYVED